MSKASHNIGDGSLDPDYLIQHSPSLLRLLLRPSKKTLCDIAIDWLDNAHFGAPHPLPEDVEGGGGLSVGELKGIYEKMKAANPVTRKAVAERIVERDWNKGLNLWQIGQLECRCIVDNSLVYKWTAGRLCLQGSTDIEAPLPRFQSSSFIYNLQTILKPMIKGYCHTFRYSELSLVLIRIQLHESTGNAQSYSELPPPKRIIFCAFPDNAPFIFWNTGVKDPLRTILLGSLAPAISRPGQRFELKSTALTANSLTTLVHMRSSARSAHALGAWSLYADNKIDKSPLDADIDIAQGEREDSIAAVSVDPDEQARRKRRKIAKARFGTSGILGDGKGINKFEVTLKNKLPVVDGVDMEGLTEFRPTVTVTFEGTHVFAGIRHMVEEGIIDGMAMPGWMTGEDGVSALVVEDGKVVGRTHKP